LDKIKQI